MKEHVIKVSSISKAVSTISDDKCPLPLSIIPNMIGINLCNVESIAWREQEDGQLIDITINFIPDPKE